MPILEHIKNVSYSVKTYLQVPTSKVASYEYKYFSNERELMELVQNGPVATWLDVGDELRFFKSGVFYKPGLCGNNEVAFSKEL